MLNKLKLILTTALLTIISITAGNAQELSLLADTILIGNHVTLSIKAKTTKKVTFPIFNDTIVSDITIVNQDQPPISTQDAKIKNYTITAFKDTLYQIPPLPLIIGKDTAFTNPVQIRVLYYIPDSTYLSKIDTTQGIPLADIKPPINLPMTFAEFKHRYGTAIMIIIAVLILILLALYIRHRIKQNKPIFIPQKPPVPAHIKALKALEKIKADGIPQADDRLKIFYDKLSYTLRMYLEDRYDIPAPDYVSREIKRALSKQKTIPQELKSNTNQMLDTADLVKFAKFKPEIYESEKHLQNAFLFVEKTALKESPKSEENNQTSNQNG